MEKIGLYREDAEANVRDYLIDSYWDELTTIFENIKKLSKKGIESAPLYELMDLESHYELKWSDTENIIDLLYRQWHYSYHVDGNCVTRISWKR